MALISSTSNPRIKEIRALARRKQREATGLCVVEGIFHVGEALAAGAVAYLVYSPEQLASPFGRELVAGAEAAGVVVHEVTPAVMASIAGKDNPQGLAAVARQRYARLEEFTAAAAPFLVALVAPQDPGNLGSILRTVDATGAAGLILIDGGVDPYHPAAIRAGMGTVFHLPVARASWAEFAAWAGAGGYRLYGTSARGRADYRDGIEYATPLVLLLGSEREGLSAQQTAACDELLRLPMRGRAGSLNLAVAAGVFLYAIHDALAGGERPSTAPDKSSAS